MPNKKKPTTLRMNPVLESIFPKYVQRFGSRSKAITEVFLCYDTMMKIEIRIIKEIFTQPEINLMLNNALSTVYTPQSIPGAVLAEMEDEIEENYTYFGVDRKAILNKLRNLTLSQQYALVDLLLGLRGKEEDEPED
jgi:hypothetical protein